MNIRDMVLCAGLLGLTACKVSVGPPEEKPSKSDSDNFVSQCVSVASEKGLSFEDAITRCNCISEKLDKAAANAQFEESLWKKIDMIEQGVAEGEKACGSVGYTK